MALFRSIQSDTTPRFTYQAPVKAKENETAAHNPALAKAASHSRHVYALDAFCGSARAVGEVLGGVALVLTGPSLARLVHAGPQELRELRASPIHRGAMALGCALGCTLGAIVGAATWLNPVDAAHDVVARDALAIARVRGKRALQETEQAWDESVDSALAAAQKQPPQRANINAMREHWLTQARQWAEHCGAASEGYLVEPMAGVILLDRALTKLANAKTPGERAIGESLRQARRALLAEAQNDAVTSCRDERTGLLYFNDSPTLLRFKCALLSLGSPVLASVNVLVTMTVHSAGALWAGAHGNLRMAGRHAARVAAAPLLGLGLQLTALAGILAPNLGRATYARLERPLTLTIAPCFYPMDDDCGADFARRRDGFAEHGLGGLPILGGRI